MFSETCIEHGRSIPHTGFTANRTRRGTAYAALGIMLFIIVSGALTLSSAVTLAFFALRAPEAYETEHGLQVIHGIPKQRDSTQLSEALAQAR